jgi:hypothetical protein
MTSLTRLKLLLALGGLILFGGGLRLDLAWLRWAGVAVVAVAWALRFSRQDR